MKASEFMFSLGVACAGFATAVVNFDSPHDGASVKPDSDIIAGVKLPAFSVLCAGLGSAFIAGAFALSCLEADSNAELMTKLKRKKLLNSTRKPQIFSLESSSSRPISDLAHADAVAIVPPKESNDPPAIYERVTRRNCCFC